MSEETMKTLETIGDILPNLSEKDKETIIIYGRGYADGKRSVESEKKDSA